MWPNPQFPADLVLFVEKILNLFCNVNEYEWFRDNWFLPKRILDPSHLVPDKERKLTQSFIFTLLNHLMHNIPKWSGTFQAFVKHLLQDFTSVSDHFETLCIMGLMESFIFCVVSMSLICKIKCIIDE